MNINIHAVVASDVSGEYYTEYVKPFYPKYEPVSKKRWLCSGEEVSPGSYMTMPCEGRFAALLTCTEGACSYAIACLDQAYAPFYVYGYYSINAGDSLRTLSLPDLQGASYLSVQYLSVTGEALSINCLFK